MAMAKKNYREEGMMGKSDIKQAFLEIPYIKGDGPTGELPRIVVRDEKATSYPANMTPLPGVFFSPEDARDPWKVLSEVARVCKAGTEAEAELGKRNAMCEHLAYAYSILSDYLREFDGDFMMSKETAETLIREAIDRLCRAGTCIGFSLDDYRSDD